MQIAESAGVLDCFRVLGAVPSRHLAVLMEHAIAFINPSLFEGWSTSVEEAKSMGKQILLSSIPVHHEQAPPRGIFFPPDDAAALADALEDTLRLYDPALEAESQREARLQLPARLKNFAMQYSQIVSRALSPQVRQPGWLQVLTSQNRSLSADKATGAAADWLAATLPRASHLELLFDLYLRLMVTRSCSYL